MKMFETFLASIPKNRSEMVNDLELPDDIKLAPYVWEGPLEPEYDESLSVRTESFVSDSLGECDARSISTDSSIPLSRAMTDSEIDYERYRRFKHRSFSDPFDHMKAALAAFPPGYLASLHSFQNSPSDLTEEKAVVRQKRAYNEELKLKMERFFEEECRVFTPDDPALIDLEDALESLDMKVLNAELDSIKPQF